jgi:hypothetical protein
VAIKAKALLVADAAAARTVDGLMSAQQSTIAGITIPDSRLAEDATRFVRDTSTQLLFDHSRRVLLWRALVGAERGLSFDAELDVLGIGFDAVPAEARDQVVAAHPHILDAKVTGYVRPDFCHFIANSPFSE